MSSTCLRLRFPSVSSTGTIPLARVILYEEMNETEEGESVVVQQTRELTSKFGDEFIIGRVS